jgi:2-iminobutanoate/2-iminopropanoate deaminase
MKNMSAWFFLALAVMCVAAMPECAADDVEYFPVMNAPPGMSLPFSEAVRVGNMLYLSGEIGTDARGRLVEGGIAAETKQVMDNIGVKLVRRGSSWDRVVQCTVALADIKDWPAFNEVYRGYFRQHFPARMAYATGGLALDACVEVQCSATIARKQRRRPPARSRTSDRLSVQPDLQPAASPHATTAAAAVPMPQQEPVRSLGADAVRVAAATS